MWGSQGVAVSLPARELAAVRLPGSVFKQEFLVTANISDELRRAIALIERSCGEPGPPPVYIARPEIFTHGESLKWLRARLGSIEDHLCVSDGSTIRVVPGMRNHVFFYALGRRDNSAALRTLEWRVPELFSTVASQINSALRIRHGRLAYTPTPVAAPGLEAESPSEIEFYKFYLGPFSVDDSISRIAQRGPVGIPDYSVKNLVYLPVTEASVEDAAFCKATASLIARTYFDPATGVVIRLPIAADPATSLAERMRGLLEGLRGASVLVPGVPAPNVFFATQDAQAVHLQALSETREMFVHDTFDFWRHSPGYYAGFGALRVAARRGRHNPAALPALLTEVCGRKPELVWPPAIDRRDRV